jgi:hypothetical protein
LAPDDANHISAAVRFVPRSFWRRFCAAALVLTLRTLLLSFVCSSQIYVTNAESHVFYNWPVSVQLSVSPLVDGEYNRLAMLFDLLAKHSRYGLPPEVAFTHTDMVRSRSLLGQLWSSPITPAVRADVFSAPHRNAPLVSPARLHFVTNYGAHKPQHVVDAEIERDALQLTLVLLSRIVAMESDQLAHHAPPLAKRGNKKRRHRS